MNESKAKPIIWIGSSFRDLKDFPREVQKEIGYALWVAQIGGKHSNAKPLKGLNGVTEIVSDFKTNTYRAVYTVKFRRYNLCVACIPKEIYAWYFDP